MNKRKINFKFVVALISISFMFWSCGGGNEQEQDAEVKANVEVGNPQFKTLTEFLTLNGNTTFIKKEVVRAVFQGYIQKTFKTIGDKINAGDPLFIIKTKEASIVDTSGLNLTGANFNGNVTVKAKSNGILSQLDFNTGDYVSDGEQIAVISNPSSLKIILNVPYQNISNVKLNRSCVIQLPDSSKLNGVISKKIPNVDAAAQTQTFLIDAPASVSLPENLNVTVKIPIKIYKGAAVVPKSAIMSSDVLDEFWIMKLINDTTAAKVVVNKGIEDGNLVQILSPQLSAGDQIVIVGAYGLPDTANVNIRR